MKIRGLGSIAFYRYFGILKEDIFGSECKMVGGHAGTDLPSCVVAYLNYIKR